MEVELRIRDILASPSRLKDKVHTVLEEFKSYPDETETQRGLLKYLFNSGHYQELFALIVEMLERKVTIPWDLMFQTFDTTQSKPNGGSVLRSILKGLEKQNAYPMIWAACGMDELIPELKDLRESFKSEFKNTLDQKRENLLEKFEFLNLQRLPVEARRVLRQLRSAYPDDYQIKELENRFQEDWARELLSERAINKSLDGVTLTMARKTVEELEFLEFWKDCALKISHDNPATIKDLTVFFLFLESPDLALKILELDAEPNYAMHWLKAEALKRSGRHIEALEQASKIESLKDAPEDTTFAVTYFKAEVFGELGHFDQALSLLESIAKIRPGYRSSNYLIDMWKHRGSGI